MLGFGSNELGSIEASAKALRERSPFISKMVDIARSSPNFQRATENVLADDQKWREVWTKPNIFTDPQQVPPGTVSGPESLLRNFDNQTRKQYLFEYLQEKFPEAAREAAREAALGRNTVFAEIINTTNPAVLGTPRLQRQIASFMQVGREMRNEAADPAVATTLTRTEISNTAKEELRSLYLRGTNYTSRAFEDFTSAMRRNPTITTTTSSNVNALKSALLHESTSFAAALSFEVFTNAQLTTMTQMYEKMKQEQNNVINRSAARQQLVKTNVEAFETRPFAQSLMENFRSMQGWQQLAVIGVGGILTYRMFFTDWKNKWGVVEKVGVPAVLGITGFYMLGGRDMLRNTTIGNALTNIVETPINAGLNRLNGAGRSPKITRDQLERYAQYFREIANTPLGGEIEAMGYLSQIPMADIASSLVISNDGRRGSINLAPLSPLSKKINEIFGPSGQAENVRQKLIQNSEKLGNSLVQVFYMIGAHERPTEYNQVESERMRVGGSYDAIPNGTIRSTYQRLADHGAQVARRDFKSSNWYEVVGKLLEHNTRQ